MTMDSPKPSELSFRVLGDLEVRRGQELLAVGPAKIRVLLASLLLGANRPVKYQDLVDDLWGDNPPMNASTVLQTYVMRLRKILGDSARRQDIIETGSSSYRIKIDPERLDLYRFDRFLRAAHIAHSAGDARAELASLTEALALWDDPVLGNVPSGTIHRDKVSLLVEKWKIAKEREVELLMETGQQQLDLLVQLRELTIKYPLHESFSLQLIKILHLTGRRVDALDACHRLNVLLAEELGIDPSPALRSLHQSILRGEPLPAARNFAPARVARGGSHPADWRTDTAVPPRRGLDD